MIACVYVNSQMNLEYDRRSSINFIAYDRRSNTSQNHIDAFIQVKEAIKELATSHQRALENEKTRLMQMEASVNKNNHA